jgi:Holliday junction resolvase RusA-like endonuclease
MATRKQPRKAAALRGAKPGPANKGSARRGIGGGVGQTPPPLLPPPRVLRDADGQAIALQFIFPVWQSKKNDVVPMRNGRGVRAGDRSKAHAAAMRAHLANVSNGASLFGSDDVSIEVQHDVATDLCQVIVHRRGPAKQVGSKTGRRRDVHNLLDTLCDALEGIAYDDDRQAVKVTARRIVGTL